MAAILVPVDGSKSALRAVDYALGVARRTRSAVHLVNVQPPLDDYGMVPAYVDRRAYRRSTTDRANAVLAPAVERARLAKVPCTAHVLYGEIGVTIAKAARRFKCDSIVMGTRGMSALKTLMLGSVTNKVIHQTTTPVTLIK